MGPLAFILILFAAGPGERYAGERLCYDFQILSALHVGTACITLERGQDSGQYIATAEAVPNVLARNFTYVRKVILRTFMVEDKDLRKLSPYRAERIILREKEEFDTIYTLAGGGWTWTSTRKDKGKMRETSGVIVAPEKTEYFEDPLSAVYNFRSGAYGDKKEGTVVRIQSLSYGGDGHITLKILPREENNPGLENVVYVMQLTAEGDTIGFRFQDVMIWVGPGEIPLKGVIRGAMPLFDITASLQKKN